MRRRNPIVTFVMKDAVGEQRLSISGYGSTLTVSDPTTREPIAQFTLTDVSYRRLRQRVRSWRLHARWVLAGRPKYGKDDQ